MWMATLGKREFLEMIAAGPTVETIKSAVKFMSKRALLEQHGKIATFWNEQPEGRHSFPVIAVVEETQIRDLLAALNASPKALSPFTSFCRIMDYSQSQAYFNRKHSPWAEILVDAISMLSLVEVQLLSEGQIKARQVSPAAARRTLSFAWGRGIAAGLSLSELKELTTQWLEAYSLCSSIGGGENRVPAVKELLSVLTSACGLLGNELPSGPIQRLVAAIVNGGTQDLDSAWLETAQFHASNISLQSIENASREERGSYLQRLLKEQRRPGNMEQGAAQGFLATQVAPGSLEHLDILLSQGGLEAAFWYVFFAALQKPHQVLNGLAGLGRRIARDVHDGEELNRPPRADIGLDELGILLPANADDLVSKVGHSNEIEVELLPGVSATFRFGRSSLSRTKMEEVNMDRLLSDRIVPHLHDISLLVEQTLADIESAAQPKWEGKSRRARKGRY